MSAGGEQVLESHRREVAMLCTELRGFGALAETGEPEAVLTVVREFHAAMGALAFQFEGTLAHLSGGGMVVLFNDPVSCSNPAERAVRLLLAMRAEMHQLQQDWRWQGVELGLAAGIALGYASVGKIGFEGRFEYGAIGQVSLLAAHLASEAQAGQILVADRVYGATRDLVDAQPVGETLPREFVRSVATFAIRDWKGAGSAADAGISALSPRERDVAALVARGLTNHQVAEELVVTGSTAAKHIENIFGKLGFSSRAQLAAWAVQQGLGTESNSTR
jgi:class 3 adenylate cyclase